ncbi:hypothetical protein LCGC14_2430760 [marine sediment metagenome]|uniref:Haem-binding domain-containing protein n=2 Tax=root TaxID=1 RepID=A0A831VQ35_9FLAO|nr:hypothetical protein [Pricia antarctica]
MTFTNGLILLFAVFHCFAFRPDAKYIYSPLKSTRSQEDLKEKAFEILRIKCNTCHAIKRKPQVFTKLNMDTLASEIYEQVFIKKKMPKGRKVKLSANETVILENWIETVLKSKKPSGIKKSR